MTTTCPWQSPQKTNEYMCNNIMQEDDVYYRRGWPKKVQQQEARGVVPSSREEVCMYVGKKREDTKNVMRVHSYQANSGCQNDGDSDSCINHGGSRTMLSFIVQ